MSTVFIIHNGGVYSDKAIYFVSAADPREFQLLDELLTCWAKAWPNDVCRICGKTWADREADKKDYLVAHSTFEGVHLLAKVSEAEWFCGRMTPAELVDRIAWQLNSGTLDVAAAQRCLAICKEIAPGYYFDVEPSDFNTEPLKPCRVMR